MMRKMKRMMMRRNMKNKTISQSLMKDLHTIVSSYHMVKTMYMMKTEMILMKTKVMRLRMMIISRMMKKQKSKFASLFHTFI